jgi:hypothetical protein
VYSPLAILDIGIGALDTDEVVDGIADDVDDIEVDWDVTRENCRLSETICMIVLLQHTDIAVAATSGRKVVEVGSASEE